MSDTFLTEEVKQKWSKVIDHPDLPNINETWKKRVTAVVLENTSRELAKAKANADGGMAGFVAEGQAKADASEMPLKAKQRVAAKYLLALAASAAVATLERWVAASTA